MRCVYWSLAVTICLAQSVNSSVFWGPSSGLERGLAASIKLRDDAVAKKARYDLRWALKQQKSNVVALQRTSSTETAMAIPGYGLAEQVFVGGFLNFLSIYNLIITARILLSWFPQAQGIAALQPVYAITDPYLNLFRGIVPPVFGLDFSPILAFLLLNTLTSATAAVGAEIPSLDDNRILHYQTRNLHERTQRVIQKFLKK